MPGSRTQNKARFIEVATIYRDAMVRFIESALGTERIHSALFNDEAKERNPSKYENGMRKLKQGTPVPNLIDQTDIPHLINDNLSRLSALNSKDVDRMHAIRLLWNDKIKHFDDFGDFNSEDAVECAVLCARVLRHCGLGEVADEIVTPSAPVATGAPAATEDDSRKQRERREWDKQRLANKPTELLTMWEQQRLVDIEWEEEWERREQERAEIAEIGRDIDALRQWFDADAGRSQRHASAFADLEQAEDARLERECAEIAEIGRDIDALRQWFDADAGRSQRHASAFTDLEQAEDARLERECAEIAHIGPDTNALGNFFDADGERRQRHPADFAWWERRDREQREYKERHETLRREREEIARIGQDINALGNFFDADDERKQRHPADFAWLESAEAKVWQRAKASLQARIRLRREREEIVRIGQDINALGNFFDADDEREQRHPADYAMLEWREQIRRAQLAMLQRLASHRSYNLVLREDGSIVCWGNKRQGRCNAPSGKYIAVSAGGSHSIALREDGSVVCWGSNKHGQYSAPSGKYVAISAGENHSIALCEDGSIVCWGSNKHGQCSAPSGKYVAVSAGVTHSVALREDGSIVCWGSNKHGQCSAPSGKYVAVSAGVTHSVALREDGSVVCWGDNSRGKCDAPSGKYTTVSAGESHSIALREDGSIVCWGNKRQGLCNAPSGKYIAVSASVTHSVAVREDGTIVCWGKDHGNACNPPKGNFLP